MPQETKDELIDVLHNLREHTNFLGELGVDNIGLDSPSDVSAPLHASVVSAPTRAVAPTADTLALSVPRRATTAASAQSSTSLFGESADAAPAVPKSTETLEQI